MNDRTKKLTTLAMLSALAYLVVVIGRIPLVLFLEYEPKHVIITIGGFIYGPFSAFIISLVVSLVEMFTISKDGIIGFIMNVIAASSFACTASFIYKKRQTISGAIIGLLAGCVAMTAMMLLWNYFITPYYMHVPRSEVAALLIPAFLPFNLIKSGLNAAITLLLYKPIVAALRRSHLVPQSHTQHKGKFNIGVILFATLLLATCILFVLVIKGIV